MFVEKKRPLVSGKADVQR